MDRLQTQCPGDCSRCSLLAEGAVEMVPCALDQLMQRVQRQGKQLKEIQDAIASGSPSALASTNTTND